MDIQTARRTLTSILDSIHGDPCDRSWPAIAAIAGIVRDLLPDDGDDICPACEGRGVVASPIEYVLWSGRHQMWWGVDGIGYATDVRLAGRFSEAEAVRYVVRSAAGGDRHAVTCMVAAPADDLAEAVARAAYAAGGPVASEVDGV